MALAEAWAILRSTTGAASAGDAAVQGRAADHKILCQGQLEVARIRVTHAVGQAAHGGQRKLPLAPPVPPLTFQWDLAGSQYNTLHS